MIRLIVLLIGLAGFKNLAAQREILWCDRPIAVKPLHPLQRIAFGSCAKQTREQPILKEIVNVHPDLMIYLGDNIYGDSRDTFKLKEKYGMLSCKPEFRKLLANVPTIATWDDHDYGKDDAGAEYPMKAATKRLFLDFWNEPLTSSRWNGHEGIYHALYYGDSATKVQILLLDLRTFRTTLIGRDYHYEANADSMATMLGSAQWQWLSSELKKPARVRIICSSTQFGTEHNGWECWDNFPKEQQRMFDLIKETKANGVIFFSGDVHYAELSMRKLDGLYPIYDMTSSGLTHREHKPAKNRYRIGEALNERNFGLLDINWGAHPTLLFRGFDWTGHERIIQEVKLDDLKF
ncbi:MAG: alkaline phosphatase D family protein [Chitinophagales bacterium]